MRGDLSQDSQRLFFDPAMANARYSPPQMKVRQATLSAVELEVGTDGLLPIYFLFLAEFLTKPLSAAGISLFSLSLREINSGTGRFVWLTSALPLLISFYQNDAAPRPPAR